MNNEKDSNKYTSDDNNNCTNTVENIKINTIENSEHTSEENPEKTNRLNIGKKLARARIKAGYSQNAAAEKVALTRLTISKYENNKSQPTFEKLQEMCDLYGTSIESLFSNDSEVKNDHEKNNTYLDEGLKNILLDQIIDGLTYEGALTEDSVTSDMKVRLQSLIDRQIKKIQKSNNIEVK